MKKAKKLRYYIFARTRPTSILWHATRTRRGKTCLSQIMVGVSWLAENQQVCWDWLVKVTRGLWIKYIYSLVSAKKVQRRDLYLSARSLITVLTRPSNCYSFRRGRNRTPLTNGTRHSKLERGRNLQTPHWLVVNNFSSSSRKLFCTSFLNFKLP